jgi:hypothetical protein
MSQRARTRGTPIADLIWFSRQQKQNPQQQQQHQQQQNQNQVNQRPVDSIERDIQTYRYILRGINAQLQVNANPQARSELFRKQNEINNLLAFLDPHFYHSQQFQQQHRPKTQTRRPQIRPQQLTTLFQPPPRPQPQYRPQTQTQQEYEEETEEKEEMEEDEKQERIKKKHIKQEQLEQKQMQKERIRIEQEQIAVAVEQIEVAVGQERIRESIIQERLKNQIKLRSRQGVGRRRRRRRKESRDQQELRRIRGIASTTGRPPPLPADLQSRMVSIRKEENKKKVKKRIKRRFKKRGTGPPSLPSETLIKVERQKSRLKREKNRIIQRKKNMKVVIENTERDAILAAAQEFNPRMSIFDRITAAQRQARKKVKEEEEDNLSGDEDLDSEPEPEPEDQSMLVRGKRWLSNKWARMRKVIRR